MVKSVPRIIISNIIGFLIFLIILIIANKLIPSVNNEMFRNIVEFINANLVLLLVMMFIGMINDIFWVFYFPFNILAPITSSVLSVYIISFIERVWIFLNLYEKFNILINFKAVSNIVVFIVLIAGYLIIFFRQGKPREEWEKWNRERLERKRDKFHKKIQKIDKKLGKCDVDWKNIGDEFKLAFYNAGKSINKFFENKKTKNYRR
jgi:hypothetical protein